MNPEEADQHILAVAEEVRPLLDLMEGELGQACSLPGVYAVGLRCACDTRWTDAVEGRALVVRAPGYEQTQGTVRLTAAHPCGCRHELALWVEGGTVARLDPPAFHPGPNCGGPL